MKAAVMTWHTYDNFGSLLQAYALQRSLEKLGSSRTSSITILNHTTRTIALAHPTG